MDAPKRYDPTHSAGMVERATGNWVQFTKHARIVAEKNARIADLEGSLRVIAETEWLEVEPGGNWRPEGSEAYVEEIEAFCNWALTFAKAALDRAALKGDDNG